jgi:branched-chain amino acid aminotransferase
VKYHVDGRLVPADEATVSVRDRGFRYGDGIFETLRVYEGSLFGWEPHADRLANSAAALGIDLPPREDLRDRLDATIAANDLDEGALRLSITRPAGAGRLTPDPDGTPTVVVTAAPLPPGGPNGDVWEAPATAAVVGTQATPDAAIPAAAKTHAYLDGVLARREAGARGADAALLRDADGTLAEEAAANLFLVRDGTLRTPSLDGPVLPGVTRRVVLDLAAERDIPTEAGTVTLDDLRAADEAFLTNTTWELRPIGRLLGGDGDTEWATPGEGGRSIGGGPVTERLREAFAERVAAACL